MPKSLTAALLCGLYAGLPGAPAAAQTAVAPGTVELDTIDVAGTALPLDTPPGTVGYTSTNSTAGTRSNTPIVEVPQSVSVVTRKQLDDRDVQTLKEAVNYTAGTETGSFGFDPRFDAFYIRGFDVTYTGVYRDDLRQGGGNFAVPRIEPYGVQDVSILRGPASGLYGLGSPGGIVAVTTKRPPLTPFGEVQLQVGNYDRYQGNFDIGGPVVGNEQFSYRLTGIVREAGTYLPGFDDNRTYIAPAVTWRPDTDTSLTLLAEHQTSRTTADPSYFNAPGPILTDIVSNDPRFGSLDQEQYRVGYAFEHRFSDLLTVRQNLRYYNVDADGKYTQIDAIDPTTNLASRSTGRVTDRYGDFAVDNQVESRFALGAARNTVIAGLDYFHSTLDDKIGFGVAPDLDLTLRNYGAQAIAAPDYTQFLHQKQDEVGAFVQDQIKLGGFILTLNARHDWVWQRSELNDGLGPTNQTDSAFTGRAGLAYLFDNGIAPYVSYATAFSPQLGRNAAGETFKPTQGEQIEGGVKYQIPDAHVLLTAAVFDITQDNVLRVDPNDIAFQVATGQVESKGFELEATASLTSNIDVIAAFTHLDVRITKGAADTTGNRLSGIPNDSFAAFAKYTFEPGSLFTGLGVGAGVRISGSSFGDDQNTFRNKSATFVDAVLDYDFGKLDKKWTGLRLQINANNIFDTNIPACQSGYCLSTERRQVIGSLVYRW